MADAPAAKEETTDQKTGQAPPDPPELARLKIEKEISDQELAIAENRSKRLQAMMPSKIEAPEGGKTTIEGDHPIESQILAYRALNDLARVIANKVRACNPRPTAIVIHNDAEVNALLALQGFDAQLDLIETRLGGEIRHARRVVADARTAIRTDEAPTATAVTGAALVVVSGVLRAAADMVALFRVNTSLKYKDLTIADHALVAAVSGELAQPNPPDAANPAITVYHPALLPPGLGDDTSAIRDKLDRLAALRGEIDVQQAEIAPVSDELKQQIAALDEEIAAGEAETPKDDKRSERNARSTKQVASERLATLTARLQAASTAFDAFQAALVKADESSGINALVRMLRAEKLKNAAGAAHWLVLKVATAGGGFKTKQFLWWPMGVHYSGGAIVEFILFNAVGAIVAAGTTPKYTGFIQIRERAEASYDLDSLTT